MLYWLFGALAWDLSAVSCSPSEPVWAEELVLMGERGMSLRSSRRPDVVPTTPAPDNMVLARGILGDAVISKLSLIFSCFSGLTEVDKGLDGSCSIWKLLSGVYGVLKGA